MYQTPEQLIAANKAGVEAAVQLANVALQSVEKLVGLQIDAAKSALAESAASARALATAKDPKDLTALRDRAVQPNLEKAQAYIRSVYDVAASTQGEIGKLIESQLAVFNKSVVSVLDKAASTTPAGTEFAITALRAAVASANAGFDNVSKVAKQVADITAANVAAATQAMPGKKKAA